jgi:hypothetical protein
MVQARSLTHRLALLVLAAPILFFCLLGLVANWPVDCGPRGCGDDSLAGSRAHAALFGFGLAAGVVGAVAIALKGMKIGVVLLALSAAMAAFGIFF